MGRACNTYGERRGACRVLVSIADGKKPSDLGGDGRAILRWNFSKWDVRWGGGAVPRLIWLGIGTGCGHL